MPFDEEIVTCFLRLTCGCSWSLSMDDYLVFDLLFSHPDLHLATRWSRCLTCFPIMTCRWSWSLSPSRASNLSSMDGGRASCEHKIKTHWKNRYVKKQIICCWPSMLAATAGVSSKNTPGSIYRKNWSLIWIFFCKRDKECNWMIARD